MRPKNQYLAFKKIDESFIALDAKVIGEDQQLTTWNITTGKLVN